MDPRDRVVTRIPLVELWTDDGELPATRRGPLEREAVREHLCRGPVRFVVASVGQRLKSIPLDERFEFWKRDAIIHLSDADAIELDDFADGVAYRASEWIVAGDESPIILLEVAH